MLPSIVQYRRTFAPIYLVRNLKLRFALAAILQRVSAQSVQNSGQRSPARICGRRREFSIRSGLDSHRAVDFWSFGTVFRFASKSSAMPLGKSRHFGACTGKFSAQSCCKSRPARGWILSATGGWRSYDGNRNPQIIVGEFMRSCCSKSLRALALFAIATLSAAPVHAEPVGRPNAESAAAPRVFVLDAEILQANKRLLREGDRNLAAGLAQLKREADEALDMRPLTVTDKDFTPPSGDKHDYMSQAPYFWADPDKADGLPYIRKDGERNPEIRKFRNHDAFNRLMASVEVLALASYFTDDEKYANKAAELLRVWFLNPETKMNPNLQHAQAIPGITTGRGIGLIETASLPKLLDAVALLEQSKALSDEDRRGLRDWFSQFLDWMLESRNGKEEANAKNNHGTFYDVQTAALALHLGKPELATTILKRVPTKRIAVQIQPDGRQPLELVRTKAWGYSTSNLNGLLTLARLGEHVNVDLWTFETDDGRSLRKAIDFLLPYALGDKAWDYQQLGGLQPRALANAVRKATLKCNDDRYRAAAKKLAREDAGGWNALLRAKSNDN
jgi:hypothetical protein